MATNKDDKPERLFKYQSYSTYSLANLEEGVIFFNEPKNFNDPFDCVHPILPKELKLEYAFELLNGSELVSFDLIEKFKSRKCSNEELLDLLKLVLITIPNPYAAHIDKSDSNLKQDFLNEIERKFHLLGNKKVYKRIEEVLRVGGAISLKFALDSVRSQALGTVKISCFTENLKSIPMWSYYADGHQGFSLEFDTAFVPFTRISKVEYVKQVPEVDVSQLLENTSGEPRMMEYFLSMKHESWIHEAEWRIILNDNHPFIKYPEGALTGVYFGC